MTQRERKLKLTLLDVARGVDGWGHVGKAGTNSASLNLSSDKVLSISPVYSFIHTFNDKNAIWGKKRFNFPLLMRKLSPEHYCGKIPLGKHVSFLHQFFPLINIIWSCSSRVVHRMVIMFQINEKKPEHKLSLCFTE